MDDPIKPENWSLWLSGVCILGGVIGVVELNWFITSSERKALPQPDLEYVASSFISAFCAWHCHTLLRIEDVEPVLEK